MDSSRKRKASSNESNRSKRRSNDDSSILAFLGVPYDLLFQRPRGKPLLSRAEAQVLTNVRLLAAELDSLVDVAEEALSGNCLENAPTDPYLRPLISLLQPDPSVLARIEARLTYILRQQLPLQATTLQQLSEQNWTLSQSLQELTPVLARERQHVSEIQDEVVRRIGVLTTDNNQLLDRSPSLADYCAQNLAAPSSWQPDVLSMEPPDEKENTQNSAQDVDDSQCSQSQPRLSAAMALSSLAYE